MQDVHHGALARRSPAFLENASHPRREEAWQQLNRPAIANLSEIGLTPADQPLSRVFGARHGADALDRSWRRSWIASPPITVEDQEPLPPDAALILYAVQTVIALAWAASYAS